MPSSKTIKLQHLKHMVALMLLSLLVFLPGLSNLPVIDRDEARFAQASVQMAESGDLLDIRFQDQTRYKKPSGIYWLQTAAIKVFSKDGDRKIWAQRLPSVLGALLAVIATYFGAASLMGRREAFIAAAMLALSALVIFEAHIAKTDAMLLGLSACCLASLARLRHNGGRKSVWIFWVALGSSIMIKGPVLPILAMLTIITLTIWEQDKSWMKRLLNWPAIIAFILIWLPWTIAIWNATDGAFFAESLGKDFGGKLTSVQESHPGPPGYYFLTIWVTLWPTCLLLLPAFGFAIQAVKKSGDANQVTNQETNMVMIKVVHLCLAWIVPYWILIELMPTKLTHYALPLFPALCTLAAMASLSFLKGNAFPTLRRINAILFLIVSLILITAIMAGQWLYGPNGRGHSIYIYIVGGVAGICTFHACLALWQSRVKSSLMSAALAAVILSIATYQFTLPNLTKLRIADQIEAYLENENITLPRHGGAEIVSPHFTEPSLVYRLGGAINVTDKIDLLDMNALANGRVIILDNKRTGTDTTIEAIRVSANQSDLCLNTTPNIEGFNYSKGDDVSLSVIRAVECF